MVVEGMALINDDPWQPVYDLTMDIFFNYFSTAIGCLFFLLGWYFKQSWYNIHIHVRVNVDLARFESQMSTEPRNDLGSWGEIAYTAKNKIHTIYISCFVSKLYKSWIYVCCVVSVQKRHVLNGRNTHICFHSAPMGLKIWCRNYALK